MRWFLLLAAFSAFAQDQTETREMTGQFGSRRALLVLHTARAADGALRLSGEYIVLPSLERRFVEGEASPEIGVTTLREGTTPILFGHEPTGELRGTLRAGTFKGMRYGPGGQERERFRFSEEFPSMSAYDAAVRCDAGDAAYASSLAYTVEAGRLKAFEWRSKLSASGHACTIAASGQQELKGGLRFVDGRCSVTLRDLGEYIRVAAAGCSEQCGSQAYLEPLLVDRRGNCRLLRPESR